MLRPAFLFAGTSQESARRSFIQRHNLLHPPSIFAGTSTSAGRPHDATRVASTSSSDAATGDRGCHDHAGDATTPHDARGRRRLRAASNAAGAAGDDSDLLKDESGWPASAGGRGDEHGWRRWPASAGSQGRARAAASASPPWSQDAGQRETRYEGDA